MSQLFTYFTADVASGLQSGDATKNFDAEVGKNLKGFLDSLTKENFVEDVQKATKALQGAKTHSMLLTAYAKALESVALTEGEGSTKAQGTFSTAAVEFVRQNSFHEVVREIKTVAKAAGVSIAELQIATDVDTQTRLAIRSDFYKKHPDTILIISVQPDLLGGVRLFKDNTVVDMSWNAQLQSILSV